ncbi:MAG: family 16 glycosylhydrolase [Lentimonas sp.]
MEIQNILYFMPFFALAAFGKTEIPMPPAEAPEGYRWELNESYSDEFDGTELNADKWHDTYPGWQGRVPGLFVPSSISVGDGHLQIKSTVLFPPKGDAGEWWIACGAVQTKAQEAHYGYYETRMKASSIRTSSTFWLMNPSDEANKVRKRTELDIQESVGNAKRWPGFKHQFRNNTHVIYYDEKNAEGGKLKIGKGASTDIGGNVSDDFHRYGCWWLDANTMHFYLDGVRVKTITPSTEIDEKPFDQKMFVNLVCEIYDWEYLPDLDALRDDSRNTTYYDYVRSYQLVKE